ncbi:unnamed protein product, partial [Ectocarpus sp. 8 AP-2014]
MDAGASEEAEWRGCQGRTLLGAAVYGKSEKMVRALLTAGAKSDVNVLFGGESESALHVAAARGAEKASTALMIAGADPNLRDRMYRSPLHLAAEAGHRHIIGILLKGADVDAWNNRQETPLHLAASKGHAPCISELLVGGADKDAVDSIGQTPLWHAADNNQLEAIEELLAAGANYRIPGADVNAETTGRDCSTPLHVAVDRRVASIGTIGALLEGGAVVNVFDEVDETPLHRACKRSNVTGVELLLRWGADEELTNEEGDAPAD